MYKHILIATDGSKLAEKALLQGLALAKDLEAAATVVTVTEPWSALQLANEAERGAMHPLQDYETKVAAYADKILSAASNTAKKLGIACDTRHEKDQYPAEGILEAAREKGCDLIVMASHGRRGLQKLLLGSQATKVLTYSSVPVLICR